jgi:hypothetical protein
MIPHLNQAHQFFFCLLGLLGQFPVSSRILQRSLRPNLNVQQALQDLKHQAAANPMGHESDDFPMVTRPVPSNRYFHARLAAIFHSFSIGFRSIFLVIGS